MASLALAIASSHAPGLTGWLEAAPANSQQLVTTGFETLEKAIDDAAVDVLIVIANDHIANSRVNEYPDFTIGMAERHEGPDEWFKDWLRVDPYSVQGDPEVADRIFKGLVARGFPTYATTKNLRFDDNLSVPLKLTNMPEKDFRIVPILQNCTVPPIPDERHCFRFGESLRDIIHQLPEDLRVGLYATGGMAHEPGGPRYFYLDEEFDRDFLSLLGKGSHFDLIEGATLEAMEAAGSGGTAELLSWLIVAAAAGETADCEVIFYDAITEMRCGIGAVQWHLEEAAAAASTLGAPNGT